MQVGFIHFDRSDQKKYLAVLDRLSEGGAIDELGIGRIRDWYSEHMFPGVSSLHRHAKYLAVLPLLYKKAATYYYRSRKEVRPQIVKLEIQMTKAMLAAAKAEGRDNSGITGNSQNLDKGQYVKYDPTYIYGTALHRYGIMRHDDIEGMIFQQSRLNHDKPVRYEGSDIEPGDTGEDPSANLLCDFIGLDLTYPWESYCSLSLTKAEAEYLRDHMKGCAAAKGTLLEFLLNHTGEYDNFLTAKKFKEFSESICAKTDVPESIRSMVGLARHFSDLVRGLFHRYNMIYSKGTDLGADPDPECEKDFLDWYSGVFLRDKEMMKASLDGIYVTDRGESVDFCRKAIAALEKGQPFAELDRIIIARERKIKTTKSKIGSRGFYDFDGRIHDYDLSYRWETISLMLREIEEGLGVWQES